MRNKQYDNHPEFSKPEICREVLNLLGIQWDNSFSSEDTTSEGGGTCTKLAWSKVYDRLLELKERGVDLDK